MSSLTQLPSTLESGLKSTGDHWNDWPNDKGFDPEYEVPTPVELSVTGNIPAYASGTLYRTGPGKSQVETENGGLFQLSHWFDGFTQTHRFQIISPDDAISPTRVWYNSRFATDALIEYVRKTGTLDRVGFGQKRDPCKTVFNKMQSEFEPPTGPSSKTVGVTLSVNMPGLDSVPGEEATGRWESSKGIQTLYLKTDGNLFQRLDPETLEPIALATQKDFHPDLSGPRSASHARSDPVAGDVFNFNLTIGANSIYRVFRVSASTGKTTILATFTGVPSYIHSLLITEDYVVLCVWNAHLDESKIGDVPFMDTILPIDPSKPATWYIVDRKHDQGLIASYESPAFLCFHTINAWQEPSKDDPTKTDIVADVIQAGGTDYLKLLLYEHLKSSTSSAKYFAANRSDEKRTCVTRFRLPALPSSPNYETLTATMEWSSCRALSPELPSINPKFITQKYRYIYSTTFRGEATITDGILKFDCDTQTVRLWSVHGHSPGEPIFVPDPDGVKEDDGVLLSVVLDGMRGHSYLLCLDAQSLTELGRANVNGPVAFGFHGQHVPTLGQPTGDY